MEHDENISVDMSLDPNDGDYCITLNFYGRVLPMHTRSAIDLHHKLGLAIADFITECALKYCEKELQK